MIIIFLIVKENKTLKEMHQKNISNIIKMIGKNMKKNLYNSIFIGFILCICIFNFNNWLVYAEEEKSYEILLIDKYTITNEKIVPGEEFTLSLYLKN